MLELVPKGPPRVGFDCSACGNAFMFRWRFLEHVKVCFVPVHAQLRQAAADGWLQRQRDLGRLLPDGSWNGAWRPQIHG